MPVVAVTPPSATLASHPRVAIFETVQLLPGSPEEVFPFFADAFNLEAITPPWLRFQVRSPRPLNLAGGTTIDYALRWRGLPVRWRTVIDAWEPPHRFVDEQLRGPYRLWRHEHTFERIGERTLMLDRVHYLAPLAFASHRLIVARDVERIFAFRRRALGRILGAA